jgi:hypothetical protein
MTTQCPATEAHERHLNELKRITTTQGRREYLSGVERAEGRFYARWLQDDYQAWHNEQQRLMRTKGEAA